MCERRVQAASRKLSSRAPRDVQRSRPKGLHDVLRCSDVRVGRAPGSKGMVVLARGHPGIALHSHGMGNGTGTVFGHTESKIPREVRVTLCYSLFRMTCEA